LEAGDDLLLIREFVRIMHLVNRAGPQTLVGRPVSMEPQRQNGRAEPSGGSESARSVITPQARMGLPVDKRRASHPLPQAAFHAICCCGTCSVCEQNHDDDEQQYGRKPNNTDDRLR
jgi:hypothetical protein